MTGVMAYHGSLATFKRFASKPPRRVSGSATAALGVFCVEDARIAAHFTLRRHVINEGYADPQGSRLLRDDPWTFDPDPFEANAVVAQVHLDIHRPKVWSVAEWLGWLAAVEALQPTLQGEVVAQQRAAWQEAGHDGLCILPWDGRSLVRGRTPSVETDATTWVAFEAEQCAVLGWLDAITAWRAAPLKPAPAKSRQRLGLLRRFG